MLTRSPSSKCAASPAPDCRNAILQSTARISTTYAQVDVDENEEVAMEFGIRYVRRWRTVLRGLRLLALLLPLRTGAYARCGCRCAPDLLAQPLGRLLPAFSSVATEPIMSTRHGVCVCRLAVCADIATA
jgi:hypothetical protein